MAVQKKKKGRRKSRLEDEQDAVLVVKSDPDAPDARERLAAGLASAHSIVVVQAARIIVRERVHRAAEEALVDLRAELAKAFGAE